MPPVPLPTETHARKLLCEKGEVQVLTVTLSLLPELCSHTVTKVV